MILIASNVAEESKPVKVFILAGQFNMEGKGKIDPLLNHQIKASETKDFFAHFHNLIFSNKQASFFLNDLLNL